SLGCRLATPKGTCRLGASSERSSMSLIDWILRRRRDDDLQAEIRAHLSMAAQDRINDGDNPEHARLAARKEFGNVTLIREATRRSWGGTWRERLIDLI